MKSQWIAHLLATGCGLLMVAAIGLDASGPARVVALAALAAVAAGVVLRPIATVAVLLVIVGVVLTAPAAAVAAVAGLSATSYLVLRHGAASGIGLDSVSAATMISAVGFTLAGLIAVAFPLRVAWLPLAAPLTVFVVYLLATRPFLGDGDD